MDVDEPGGEVRINAAQGLTVEAVVQRQVLSIFQSQVTPLLGQLMDRLEAIEARQSAERATPHTNIEAATLGQDTLAGDFQKMMSLGVESVASERKMVASRVSVEGRIEHASQHRPSSVDDTPNSSVSSDSWCIRGRWSTRGVWGGEVWSGDGVGN